MIHIFDSLKHLMVDFLRFCLEASYGLNQLTINTINAALANQAGSLSCEIVHKGLSSLQCSRCSLHVGMYMNFSEISPRTTLKQFFSLLIPKIELPFYTLLV